MATDTISLPSQSSRSLHIGRKGLRFQRAFGKTLAFILLTIGSVAVMLPLVGTAMLFWVGGKALMTRAEVA